MFSINSHVYQGLTGWRKRKENGWNVVNIKVEFVSQLIYLSEVGALLLASKIPVNLKELFIIFIQRTLITLPVIALIAHLIFYLS